MKKNDVTIPNPHDQFFRTAMADKRVALDFLRKHLPKDLARKVNFDNLVLQPRSFINDVRKESAVDVLFKTTIDRKEAFLYLLVEHQSKPDELMPFRILKYTCNILDDHLEKHKKILKGKDKKLPLIYPMVIYHGKTPYRHTTDIHNLVDAPKALVDQYFLKPFQLIDLVEIEDEQLKEHAWSGVVEFALKHIFARDVLPHIKNIANLLATLDKQDGRSFVEIVLQYFLERGEIKSKEQFFELINDNISHEVGGDIMTLAEQLREEGQREKALEIARSLLEDGSDPSFVAKVTKLPLPQVKDLKKKIN